MYGAVMGLAGLGLASRAAAPVLPKLVAAPAYFTELWVALGALALAILLPAYLYKLARFPAAVREEFRNPAQLGFRAALPVGMTLVAGGLAPYAPAFASGLWWAGVGLLLILQVWGIARLLEGGIELGQVNAGWLILFVGGIVVAGPGITLGHVEASRFMFGVSAAAAPFIMALALYRAVVGPAMPEALRPTWFILLVPPALIYANGIAFFRELAVLELLFYSSVLLALGLLLYARRFLAWPFGTPWWAFTFPLDALAYAAARYAGTHPSPLWQAVTGLALLLATAAVALVLVKTLASPFAILRSAASRPA
jgi:tellurite resistance protein